MYKLIDPGGPAGPIGKRTGAPIPCS